MGAAIAPFGGMLVLLGVIGRYLYAGGGRMFLSSLPQFVQSYALPFVMLLLLVIMYLSYRRMLAGPRIAGELLLEEGKLKMTVCRANRTEDVELDVKTLTFVENDEERVKVVSPQGEYIFNSSGFGSPEEYEKFRIELTCEKYKK